MRSLINNMDFRSLEVRLFKAKVKSWFSFYLANSLRMLLAIRCTEGHTTTFSYSQICLHKVHLITSMQHQINSHISHIHVTNTNSVSLSWLRGYNYNEINTGKHFEEQFQSMLCKASFFYESHSALMHRNEGSKPGRKRDGCFSLFID